MNYEIGYPDNLLDRLHIVWGEGFLSPGGVSEVREIVRNLDISGKAVLDIGFGTGGPAMVLAGELRAGALIGIDLEPQLKRRADALAKARGVENTVDFQVVVPGNLPFADDHFDVVFSKDSIIHVPDKTALFREVLRVLKPGGVFAASDWLVSTDPVKRKIFEDLDSDDPKLRRYRLATAPEMEQALTNAGFSDVSSRDRNLWFADLCRQELKAFEGPMYDELIDKVGADIVEPWIELRKAVAAATIAGGLRPTHLRGIKRIG